jgi:hypothetical protein
VPALLHPIGRGVALTYATMLKSFGIVLTTEAATIAGPFISHNTTVPASSLQGRAPMAALVPVARPMRLDFI